MRVDECNDLWIPKIRTTGIKSDSETAKQLPGLMNDGYDLDNIGVRGMSLNLMKKQHRLKSFIHKTVSAESMPKKRNLFGKRVFRCE